MKRLWWAYLALLVLPMSALAQAPAWTLTPEGNTLGFTARYGTDKITGSFQQFEAEITLDPKQPETGRIRVSVDMQSLSTEDADASEYLPQEEWLDSAAHPHAVFVSDTITRSDDGRYRAEGTLTMKDISAPVKLSFTLQLTEDGMHAEAKGRAQLSRLSYQIGGGEWASTDLLKDAVTLRFKLKATRE